MSRTSAVLVGTALATGTIALGEVVASYTFLWGVNLLDTWPRPWTAWVEFLAYHGRNAYGVHQWLTLSAVPGVLLMLLITVCAGRRWRMRRKLDRPLLGGGLRPLERGVTDNHGHADWASLADLRKRFPGPDPRFGGVVVGECYRVDQDRVARIPFDKDNPASWGRGGKESLLIDPCKDDAGNSITFAGQGGFKTTTMVSTALHWTGSLVVHDPSCEIGPMVAAARERLDHRVIQMDLANPESGCNVLSWIDPEKPGAAINILSVTAWICGDEPHRGKDVVFDSAGRNIVACLLAHMLWDPTLPAEDKTLQQFVEGVSLPEPALRRVLAKIADTSASTLARRLARTIMGLPDVTFGGACFNAYTFCAWLFIDENARFLSANAFQPSDLMDGRTDVFVQIPLHVLKSAPALGAVAIGALINAVFDSDGTIPGRVLFDLDEAARLGRMKILEIARDAGRKYGITLRLWYQSEGHLEQVWGRDGVRPWFDSLSYRCYAAVQDPVTAKALETQLGTHGVMAYSEGDNRGRSSSFASWGSKNTGTTENRHEISVPLIRAAELMQDVRLDEMFIIPRAGKPIRCGRAIYFRRPEMVEQIDTSRFVKEIA